MPGENRRALELKKNNTIKVKDANLVYTSINSNLNN